jgi:HD-like signal output (HDOD) protein
MRSNIDGGAFATACIRRPIVIPDKIAVAKRILSTLSCIDYLGAPPELSVRLLSKMKDEKSSIDDIAELVLLSPPIAASLLKLCNSVYFSRGKVINSVSRAIVHLGLSAVVRFVYAMDIMSSFRGGRSVVGFHETTFWKSSLAGALLAQEIGGKEEAESEESVFLGGLLRDIGICVMRQYFPDLFEETWSVAEKKQCSYDDACTEVCGLVHRSIAFLLAAHWKLPETVMAVFQPPARGHERFQQMMLTRNIVLYSDYVLKVKKVFMWDKNATGDFSSAMSLYREADVLDQLVTHIVSDVNELHSALK